MNEFEILRRNILIAQYAYETQAIFDYALSQEYSLPTNTQAYDNIIRDLVDNGLFSKLDYFNIFTKDGSNEFKLINTVNPGNPNASVEDTILFEDDGVYKTSDIGAINTNLDLSLNTVDQKYKLNNACRFAVCLTEGGNIIDGNSEIQGDNVLYHLASNSNSRINNQGSFSFNLNTSGLGFIGISRYSNNEVNVYNKDVLMQGNTISDKISPNTQVLFRRGTVYGSALGLSCYGIGEHFSYEEVQLFRQLYNKYLLSVDLPQIA